VLDEQNGPRCSSSQPKGFKVDSPSVADYRRRLTTLARSVAADIDA
jgi:hypothetical protein